MTVTYAAWQEHRGCLRKKYRYTSQYDANTAVLKAWARGEQARPYRCRHCSGWHLTSQTEEAT